MLMHGPGIIRNASSTACSCVLVNLAQAWRAYASEGRVARLIAITRVEYLPYFLQPNHTVAIAIHHRSVPKDAVGTAYDDDPSAQKLSAFFEESFIAITKTLIAQG
jgi:hypothetical protein